MPGGFARGEGNAPFYRERGAGSRLWASDGAGGGRTVGWGDVLLYGKWEFRAGCYGVMPFFSLGIHMKIVHVLSWNRFDVPRKRDKYAASARS